MFFIEGIEALSYPKNMPPNSLVDHACLFASPTLLLGVATVLYPLASTLGKRIYEKGGLSCYEAI